jgi:hypothetical protein
MSLNRFTIWILVMICTVAVHATAQKNELSGMLGRTLISDQSIQGAPAYDPKLRFGDGLTFELNYARHIIGGDLLSLSLEVPFVVNADDDLHAAQNVIPQQYSSYFVTPAARLNLFPEQAVSPWVSIGGGLGHLGPSSTLEFGSLPNLGKTGTNTGVLQAGFGLDVRLFKRFTLRGELREFWSGEPKLNVITSNSRQLNQFVAGGVVWHF